jgi:hypothetical protein
MLLENINSTSSYDDRYMFIEQVTGSNVVSLLSFSLPTSQNKLAFS